jgi:oligosaccharide translocation protein RFT1
MALNGVLEAFVASVATEPQVHVQSLWMSLFSLVFAATGVVFLRVLGLGAVGLVIANSVNMACRIIWCLWFTRSFFRRLGVDMKFRTLLPNPLAVLIAAAGAHVAAKFSAPDLISGTVSDKFFALAMIAGVALPLFLVL